jgi:hypothetical protein
MTHNSATYVRAILTVCAGLALAFVVGGFLATPVNPAKFRQIHAKLDLAIQTGMVFREGEEDAYLAVPNRPDPPLLVAVLDWHAWLIAPGLLLAFLVFRPAAIPSLVVSCAAAGFLYYFVATNSALILLASAAFGAFSVYWRGKNRPQNARDAA